MCRLSKTLLAILCSMIRQSHYDGSAIARRCATKVLINTLTNIDIYKMQELDKDFNPVVNIKGQLFIPGEWTHVADTLDTSAYPYIKEVSVHLEEETKRVLTENGLNNFAKGVEESYEMYSKVVPAVAVDIKKYAPPSVSAEVMEEVKE